MAKKGFRSDGTKATNYWLISRKAATCKWYVCVVGALGVYPQPKYVPSKENAYSLVRRYRKMQVSKSKSPYYKEPLILVRKNCGGEWVTISAHRFDTYAKEVVQ